MNCHKNKNKSDKVMHSCSHIGIKTTSRNCNCVCISFICLMFLIIAIMENSDGCL